MRYNVKGDVHASVIHCLDVKAKDESRLSTNEKVSRIPRSTCVPYKMKEYRGLHLWSTNELKDLFRLFVSASMISTRV